MRTGRLPIIMAVVVLLAACGPSTQATPTATPKAPTPTSAVPQPTKGPVSATPTAAPTPAPTAAPVATAGPRYGGTLRHSERLEPEGWDPHGLATFSGAMAVYAPIYRGIMALNSGPGCQIYPLEGDLAESWSWKNDVTLELKLRQGIRFQGAAPVGSRELVAQDVVANVKDVFARQPYVEPAARVTNEVSAVDKYTVRFSLKQPFADYVEQGVAPQQVVIVAPENITPDRKWTLLDHTGTGTGPFVLKRYLPGVKTELEKNRDYSVPGLPYLDAITILIVPEDSTALTLARTGQTDTAHIQEGSPIVLQDATRTAPRLVQKPCATFGNPVAYWRTDKPPFNDVRVRRALSMAVDRDSFNKTVWLGYGIPRWSPVHAAFGDWQLQPNDLPANVREYTEYHPDKAKALLAEAGYRDGLKVKLVFSPAYSGFSQVAEAITAHWSAVGVKVTLDALERGAYSTQVTQRASYEDAALSFAYSDTIDYALYAYFRSDLPRNRSHVSDPELDKMLEAQRTMLDEKARRKLVNDIQLNVISNQYMLYLPMSLRSMVHQPYVKNASFKAIWAPTQLLRYAWLEK